MNWELFFCWWVAVKSLDSLLLEETFILSSLCARKLPYPLNHASGLASAIASGVPEVGHCKPDTSKHLFHVCAVATKTAAETKSHYGKCIMHASVTHQGSCFSYLFTYFSVTGGLPLQISHVSPKCVCQVSTVISFQYMMAKGERSPLWPWSESRILGNVEHCNMYTLLSNAELFISGSSSKKPKVTFSPAKVWKDLKKDK